MRGARIEVYSLSGKLRFSGTADSEAFHWQGASSHETYLVRLRRGAKPETLRLSPLL
jgi:hypothetical protein